MSGEKKWLLYILECRDGTLYTGITNDLQKRLTAHNKGVAAKYTCGRTPVKLRYTERCEDHSHALKRELAVKKLSRAQKDALCSTFSINEVN